MFIYSFKASSIKFVGIVCIALVALITLIAFVPAYGGAYAGTTEPTVGGASAGTADKEDTTVSYKYEKVKSADDAAAFLRQFGWSVDAGSAEVTEVTIPAEFDKIFAGYNELQKAQGLDLSGYKKKAVTRYTFTLTDYKDAEGKPYDGRVYANVLVYRNRVIGGDICSADVNGFIHGFELPRGE
jgi:hypothetical protein